MLGKLLKYEFFALARVMLPVYAGAILLSLLTHVIGLGGLYDIPAFAGTAIFFSMISMFGIFGLIVLTFIFIIQRFYLNFFRDQGYLTHTLPVSVNTLIWSKLIAAFCWSAATVIVIFISIFLMASGFAPDYFFSYGFDVAQDAFYITGFSALLSFLHLIVAGFSGTLMVYAALSIGQLVSRMKILLAVGVYFGMSFALSMISAPITFALMWDSGSFGSYQVFNLLFSLAQGIGFYFITRGILKHKLNLE